MKLIIKGHIENNAIIPDDEISLPDGTEVKILTIAKDKKDEYISSEIPDDPLARQSIPNVYSILSSFEDNYSIEELAAKQGVSAADDFNKLLGDFWPDDENADEFIAAVHQWRKEGDNNTGENI